MHLKSFIVCFFFRGHFEEERVGERRSQCCKAAGTHWNGVPVLKVFKSQHIDSFANHLPSKYALDCRILYIQYHFLSGVDTPRRNAPRCFDPDINLPPTFPLFRLYETTTVFFLHILLIFVEKKLTTRAIADGLASSRVRLQRTAAAQLRSGRQTERRRVGK